MTKLENKINEFKNLSKAERYKKVMAMLEILKEDKDIFQDFYEILDHLKENVDDNLLETIYSMIVSAMIVLEEEENRENISRIKTIKEKIEKLKQIEKQKKEEDDPDKLLEEIL